MSESATLYILQPVYFQTHPVNHDHLLHYLACHHGDQVRIQGVIFDQYLSYSSDREQVLRNTLYLFLSLEKIGNTLSQSERGKKHALFSIQDWNAAIPH